MRRVVPAAALAALVISALLLAGCGGGSSSSGNSGNSEAAAWTKEMQLVMRHFENHISAKVVETISTSSSQSLLEPVYRGYATQLAGLAKELEATDAPEACVPVRNKIARDARRVSELNGELGEQRDLSETKYGFYVDKQGVKLAKYGSELTALAAKPDC